MKKYLFLAIAALGFAACSDSDLNGGKDPIHKGEIEESYIAINLSASDITRADAPVFEDGTEAERAVHHADFFFFDGEGNAFNVTGNPATGAGGGVNHLTAIGLSFSKDSETTDDDDISDSSNAVLLLQTYKGEYPSQIVAVLNWSPDPLKAYSLSELKLAVANLVGSGNAENHFIMSNAVYAQGSTEVYAAPLTIDNIKNNETDAKDSPVTIYVERVAAKVKVNANASYDLDKEVDYVPLNGATTVKGGVHAKIIGWDLYRDNTQSKLLKEIDADWTIDEIGFAWNDNPWYRSYWATSLDAPINDEIFSTPLSVGTTYYIGENTTEDNTKVIIKAQLVNGDNNPLEIAVWNNVEYIDEVNSESERAHTVRIAVANTLKNTYYAKDGNTYTGITPEDLVCVAGGTAVAPDGVKANEVYFQLSTTGEAKNWHKLVNGEYKPVANDTANDENSIDAMNAALKSVPSAVLYTNGETFYYVDIKHLGAPGKDAEFGIVRNHAYNITINSIKGYGSPVYTGVSFLEYPQTPEQNTYVSAKINILSWRLVDQTVDIQPQNPQN